MYGRPKAWDDRLARPTASSQITGRQWREICAAFGERCAYCGGDNRILCMEHTVPRSRGGDGSIENIVPACHPCNSAKGSLTAMEWICVRAGLLRRRGVGTERLEVAPYPAPPMARPALLLNHGGPIPVVVTRESAQRYYYRPTAVVRVSAIFSLHPGRESYTAKENIRFLDGEAA